MTRNEFELIARTLKACGAWTPARAHRDTCEAFADMCGAQNARFDRARFLKACGVAS